tara:strand:+ start:755 stop:3184 length:2430 start_codon:yes stop_codon:yes gene_type:complete
MAFREDKPSQNLPVQSQRDYDYRLVIDSLNLAAQFANRALEGSLALKMADKQTDTEKLLLEMKFNNQEHLLEKALQKDLLLGEYNQQRSDIYRKTSALTDANILNDEYRQQIEDSEYFTDDGKNLLDGIASFAEADLFTSLDEVEATGNTLQDLGTAIEKNKKINSSLDLLLGEAKLGEVWAKEYYSDIKSDLEITRSEMSKEGVGEAFMNAFTEEYSYINFENGEIVTNVGWNARYASAMNYLSGIDIDVANANLLKIREQYGDSYYTQYSSKLNPNHADYDEQLAKEYEIKQNIKILEDAKEGASLLRETINDKFYGKLMILLGETPGVEIPAGGIFDNTWTDTGTRRPLNTYSRYFKNAKQFDLFEDAETIKIIEKQLRDDFMQMVDRAEEGMQNVNSYDIVEALLDDYEGTSFSGSLGEMTSWIKNRKGEDAAEYLMNLVFDTSNPLDIKFKESVDLNQDHYGKHSDGSFVFNEGSFKPMEEWDAMGSDGLNRLLNIAQMYYYVRDAKQAITMLEDPNTGIPLGLHHKMNASSPLYSGATADYLSAITASYKEDMKGFMKELGYEDVFDGIQDIIEWSKQIKEGRGKHLESNLILQLNKPGYVEDLGFGTPFTVDPNYVPDAPIGEINTTQIVESELKYDDYRNIATGGDLAQTYGAVVFDDVKDFEGSLSNFYNNNIILSENSIKEGIARNDLTNRYGGSEEVEGTINVINSMLAQLSDATGMDFVNEETVLKILDQINSSEKSGIEDMLAHTPYNQMNQRQKAQLFDTLDKLLSLNNIALKKTGENVEAVDYAELNQSLSNFK